MNEALLALSICGWLKHEFKIREYCLRFKFDEEEEKTMKTF